MINDFVIYSTSDEFYHKEQEQRISKGDPNIITLNWIKSLTITECNTQKSDNERLSDQLSIK